MGIWNFSTSREKSSNSLGHIETDDLSHHWSPHCQPSNVWTTEQNCAFGNDNRLQQFFLQVLYFFWFSQAHTGPGLNVWRWYKACLSNPFAERLEHKRPSQKMAEGTLGGERPLGCNLGDPWGVTSSLSPELPFLKARRRANADLPGGETLIHRMGAWSSPSPSLLWSESMWKMAVSPSTVTLMRGTPRLYPSSSWLNSSSSNMPPMQKDGGW